MSPEIFTDVESKKERIRQQMRLMGFVTALLAFETFMGATQLLKKLAGASSGASMDASVLTIVLAGGFAALALWCLWQMERAYRRQR